MTQHAVQEFMVRGMTALGKRISTFVATRGFFTPRSISTDLCPVALTNGDAMLGKLMLVNTELCEAAEAARDGDMENFKEELADAVIRIFDICGACGIDIEEAVAQKMLVNVGRPPKHGRKTTL